ncbi:MAG: HAD-IA family hydrolase [Gammaproteobacteria bacterium]|nr:HAD-IA family hydrolase [Gammaproteobacteria bacterium]
MKNVKALSFDLDDTLYNNVPVIRNAFLELYNYLVINFPNIAVKYSFDNFIHVATTLRASQSSTANLNLLRRLHIQKILSTSGYENSEFHASSEKAFNVFWQARQKVSLFPNVHETLNVLSEKLPLVAISNGNACIKIIGINQYFKFSINASDTGKPKPDSSMFLLACEKLEIEPEQLVHIGDSIEHDVNGAKLAGCRAIWFNHNSENTEIKNNNADSVIEQLSALLAYNF